MQKDVDVLVQTVHELYAQTHIRDLNNWNVGSVKYEKNGNG